MSELVKTSNLSQYWIYHDYVCKETKFLATRKGVVTNPILYNI